MNITHNLRSTITVASVTGHSSTGAATLGAQRTMPARIENQRRLIRRANGQESQASHRIYTVSAIALTDRIWLPGSDTSSAREAREPLAVTAGETLSGSMTLYEVDL